MAEYGFTRWLHEWTVKYAFTDETDRPQNFEVLLFNAEEDELDYLAEMDDITTEPDGASYTRHIHAFDDLYSNIRESRTSAVPWEPATFDVSEETAEVDAVCVAWEAVLEKDIIEEWESQQNGGNGETEDWEDTYEFDAYQSWEEDPNFDPNDADPSLYPMTREPLEDVLDLEEWGGEIDVGFSWEIHTLF